MNILFFLWCAAQDAAKALGRHIDRLEQQDAESYLGKAQSFADLENRQRNWLQTH